MRGQNLFVGSVVVVLLLAIFTWSGCGKPKPSTDLLDQPVDDAASATATGTEDGDMPPPPPPAATGETTGESGTGGTPPPVSSPPPEFADVLFEFDRHDLTADGRQTMARNARLLEQAAGLEVVIEGHCDERGTIEYNLALGEKRAGAAKEYLVTYGIAASRLRTVSFGEERPLERTATEEAWARNRRAHLRGR